MPVFIDQCSLVCVHLAFFDGLKGCKLRMRIQHLSMNKYILLVTCDSMLTSWHIIVDIC